MFHMVKYIMQTHSYTFYVFIIGLRNSLDKIRQQCENKRMLLISWITIKSNTYVKYSLHNLLFCNSIYHTN